MIIAMDGEDALRDLGAEVITAASVSRAREAIANHEVDLAVLDFNLGNETSLPVAELLAERGVSFLFATGYGDGLDLPRSEEHTSELQSLMRISYAVFCLKKKTKDR